MDGALVVGATVPIASRLALHPSRTQSIAEEDLMAVSEEWGGALAVLGGAMLDARKPTGTLDLSECRVTYRDRLASRYLAGRFEGEFPESLKALLLKIEGDLNTARLLLPATAHGHEEAVFRAKTVGLYHSLTALRQVSDRFEHLNTPELRGVKALLADAPTKRLLSREGELVRNRCVHYEMNDPAILPNPRLTIDGVVEAVFPGNTCNKFAADVDSVTARTAAHLAAWKPTRTRRW